MLDDDAIVRLIKRQEGFRSKPYHCTAGKLTIGYGRNIEDNGITKEEAEVLLKNDIITAIHDAKTFYPNLYDLSDNRRNVLVSMSFAMGYPTLRGFRNLRRALLIKDYKMAALEILDSTWARNKATQSRAQEMSRTMEKG